MSINIDRLSEIRTELEELEENEVLYISRDGADRFVILPIKAYEDLEDMMAMLNDTIAMPQIQVSDPADLELTYDEYERIKEQIIDALEKTLMPKPEKLN